MLHLSNVRLVHFWIPESFVTHRVTIRRFAPPQYMKQYYKTVGVFQHFGRKRVNKEIFRGNLKKNCIYMFRQAEHMADGTTFKIHDLHLISA